MNESQSELNNINNIAESNNVVSTTTDSLPESDILSNKKTTYIALPITKQASESKERKIIKENFQIFGFISIIYAMFYTFCLYHNSSGITVPLLEVGTIYYYIFMIKQLEINLKKDSVFYIIAIILLGFSICFTDNIILIMMSKLGIMILFMSFMIHQFYNDTNWRLQKGVEALGVLAIYTVAAVGYPFADALEAIKSRQKKKNGILKYVFIGIMITVPLLFIIIILLLSADRIFENIFNHLLELLFVWKNLFTIIVMIVLSYITFYSFINALAKRDIKEEDTDRRTQEPIIAITISVCISFIYLLFCGIQIVGLFCGQMKIPTGYTYAQYAREGFFQLLVVCAINLAIVLCCMAFFRNSKILNVMLTIITICTFIMIASSAYRMLMYISIYQLTFLRIFVLWTLLVIAIIMLGIVINIYKNTFPLFRYSMVIVTIFYIGLAFSHPDYFIASYNMKSIESNTQPRSQRDDYYCYGDIYYVTSLSADAAPALAKYKNKDPKVMEYFANIKNESEKMGIRKFNFSRYIGGRAANEYLNQ
ncbi:MAG: DUF4153 domain-containing protein [Lachnotalea sp.]